MIVDIPYGKDGAQRLEIPDGIEAETVRLKKSKAAGGPKTIESSLKRPLGGKRLSDFLAGARNIRVVVNDATRPTPTAEMLGCILPDLRAAKKAGAVVRYIVAVGSHRPPTDDERLEIFGKHYAEIKSDILVHDSRNEDGLEALGKTSRGTIIAVNKTVTGADRIVLLGSVEPHYFAGFTGGRKSIFPGLQGYRSIEQNHRLAMEEGARVFALDGNPVHEDLMECMARVAAPVFAMQAVAGPRGGTHACFSGCLDRAFFAAAQKSRELFEAGIGARGDIVVAVATYPLDVDLLQAQKAIENGRLALAPGGTLILVAQCRDGFGGGEFHTLLSGARQPADAMARMARVYRLGYHRAWRLAELLEEGRLFAVTDIEPEKMEMVFMRPFSNAQVALDAALRGHGRGARVVVLADGSFTVPMPQA